MRLFWPTAAVLAATAAYVVFFPSLNLALGRGLLRHCPVRFGDWNGEELSFEDAVVDELKADDLLLRRYERGGDVLWLLIIYHQNARYGAHDPRLCYDSQGYVVVPGPPARVPAGDGGAIDVSTFWAERPHDRRLVYYWWHTEGMAGADRGAMQRMMALRGMLDNRSWGAFVRVETLAPPGQEERATRDCREFAAAVLRVLPSLFAEGPAAGRGAGEGS